MAKMNYSDFKNNISLIYGGRFLHHLRYKEAEQLLKILKKKSKKDAFLFFSLSALGTDLAKDYEGQDIPLKNRFFKIKKELRERFKIKEKVCLYSLKEVEDLFSKYFQIIKVKKTAFGNINIILKNSR